MGCISSVASERYSRSTYNIDEKKNPMNENHNKVENNEISHCVNSNIHKQIIIVRHDEKTQTMALFIKKYKLQSLAHAIYNEEITVDFLLSQDKNDIILIAQQLTNTNIIQQKKFIYAVTKEKLLKKKLANSNKNNIIRNIPLCKAESNEANESNHPNIQTEIKINQNNRQVQSERNKDTFCIFINYPCIDTPSLPLLVHGTDTISNVLIAFRNKHKFFLKTVIPKPPKIEMQNLMYCGTQMMHNKNLSSYGIIANSDLYITFNKQKKINIFITIRRHSKYVMSMMVFQQTKIKRLKQKIEKKWGISIRNQRLKYNNKELSDNDCIKHYEIKHNHSIYLDTKMGLYSVFVNICYMNKCITMGVEKYDTIKRVKMQIQLYLDMPFHKQKLIYLDNELLNDNATIKSANIVDGSILHVHSN